MLQLFSFADTFRGLYDDSIPNAQAFYTSSGYSVSDHFCYLLLGDNFLPLVLLKSTFFMMQDELLWAAAWLYRATKDVYYLKYVVDNAVSLGGTGWAVKEFSWDNKYAGVQILLTKVIKIVQIILLEFVVTEDLAIRVLGHAIFHVECLMRCWFDYFVDSPRWRWWIIHSNTKTVPG